MRKHRDLKGRGKSLYSAVTMSQFSNKEAALRAGYKDNTFYSHVKQEYLDFSILAKYGRAINYDFSMEYPEMDDIFPTIVNKNADHYKDYDSLQTKYMTLLEKHKDLMEKYTEIQERINLLESKLKK
ncbi:hypothetical protein SAMN05421820_11163 [Pedobacter steynii]|uniref:Uncharacterized protein n=1 Tax=Pedobacter steynii TaxID=430522 RepID=A0A1H0G756_9SPHI|nr:hypothetical protein [Pedobacter steynii]NQX42343.1 hypothetical protein [Pedobacter steynii]SDO02702.1 hypothetical protein SAMN05421820_11163 [Pedobacter steynii]